MSRFVPIFCCPVCGGRRITAVIKAYEYQEIEAIEIPDDSSGAYVSESYSEYDHEDSSLEYFCCSECGEPLAWLDGREINTVDELVAWLHTSLPPAPNNVIEID